MTDVVELKPGPAASSALCAWLATATVATKDRVGADKRRHALRGPKGAPLAFAGLAGEAPDLLLRSVVVQRAARLEGVGGRLVAAPEGEARPQNASALRLLTKGAAPLFKRLRFATMERDAAPPSFAESGQFRGLRPASAALMSKPH